MALQTSGQISLNDIHVEAGGSSGTTASINDSDIRGLISKGSGVQMSFSEWYGASNVFAFTISANTANGNLSTLATNAGWNGTSAIEVTINSNVYMYATDTSNYGLLVNVANSTVKNYGYIMGMGGRGADSTKSGSGKAYQSGYPAISITQGGCSIINYSGAYIGGGGGGGALGTYAGGGGGAGGGLGGNGSRNHALNGRTPGAGGTPGNKGAAPVEGKDSGDRHPGQCGGAGGNGTAYYDTGGDSGGSGGRIFPGLSVPGGYAYQGHGGGSGGGGGKPGGTTSGPWDPSSGNYSPNFGARTGSYAGGGGGGWGAAGEGGGAGGAAISKTTTYTLSNSGTIYGAT